MKELGDNLSITVCVAVVALVIGVILSLAVINSQHQSYTPGVTHITTDITRT